MASIVNYAEVYGAALDQVYKQGLLFNALYSTPNNNTIKFINAKTVNIPHITTGGYVNVDRDSTGTATRNADNEWEPKTLQHDREFRTLVDPEDIDESNIALSIANITSVFNMEHKIPEMDKYMASKLYTEFINNGGAALSDDLSASNVLEVFDDLMQKMDEEEVPQQGRLLYVTPAVNKYLKNAQQIERRMDIVSNPGTVTRTIHQLEDVQIIVVPPSRLKTAYDFTSDAVADSSAQQINMILVHPLSIVSPAKYAFVSLDEPAATTGGKYLYYERQYWDVFLLTQKKSGLLIHADSAATTTTTTTAG